MKKSSIDGFFSRFSGDVSSHGRMLAVHLELTRRCNLRCKHCYLPLSKRPGDTPELSLSSVKQIIDDLHAAGCLLISLTGGEVFTRPDITSILDYLWRKGFIVTIATNGALIDERMARFLAGAASPTYLWVSLYGLSEATTSYATGVAGVSEKTLRAIDVLKKNKVAFTIEALVTRKNFKDLEGTRDLARQIAVPFQYQYLIYPRLDGSRDVLRHQIPLKDIKRLLCNERSPAFCSNNVSSAAPGVSRTNPFYCAAGRTSMAINAFGRACACVNLPLPNIDILSSGVEVGWRKTVEYIRSIEPTDTYHCHACSLQEFCAWCPAIGWLYKKDLNACVPFYKREAQIEKTVGHG